MTTQNLTFRAGPGAFDTIRRHGFAPERIGTIAGASGGAKWLVLSQLDRVILSEIVPQLSGPVHLIGTSIGSWRFACYAQDDPVAAIERFEEAYIHQEYSADPDIHEITAKSREILDVIVGEEGASQILSHPVFRTHIMTVRARHIAASEQHYVLGAALILAASLNLVSRRTLGWFFERALFFDARDLPPFFDAEGFRLQRVILRDNNLLDAIVATGSIPLVLNGVRDIEGALHGVYRDGGVIDYHLDLPQADEDRLALYPHFYDYIVPGWFDKKLSWRRPDPAHVDRTILVSPSQEFVAGLPNNKVPDRTDFETFTPEERMRLWRQVVAECRRLADELNDVMEKGQLESRLRPL
ncbi:MAG: patatin-like phospholipase family protein [Woeseiaceae bacterium]